jgi:O-antigen biosynthesis protein
LTAPGQSETGPESSSDEEVLALRLRVAELERHLEVTAAEVTTRTALLDATYRSRAWRGVEWVAGIRRVLGPDAAVSAGYDGSGALGVRVPLAGLLGRLDGGPGAPWTDKIDVAGVVLGGLPVDPPTGLWFPVSGLRTVCVRAFAALRPGAWTYNRGGVRFRVRLVDSAGQTLAETVRDVDPATRRADRRWVPLTLPLPPVRMYGELTITTELPPSAPPDFSWAVLGDPVLLVAPTGESVAALSDGRGALRSAAARLRTGRARASPVTEDAAPLVSVLLPVHNPEPELLQQAVDSVFAQTSGHWELCIVDDGSTRAGVAAILDRAARDERVTLQRQDSAQGISAATNAALARARGTFVATLDHDDLLAPEAITAVGARLAVDPDVDVLYTDNDKVAASVRFSPSLKPGWSPELLRACMYTLHFSVYRRKLIQEVGGWRSDFDGAQDHDLMLRVSERTDRIVHLPQTLYSWRAHAGSAALGDQAKPEAYDRGLEAVQEHLRRAGVEATAEALPIAGRFRVAYAARGERTAVVLPLRAGLAEDHGLAGHLKAVAAALDAERSEPVQLVVVAAGRTADAATALDDRATLITVGSGTWGSLARAGAAAATDAEVLVLLEELCAPLTADWLEELIGPLRDRGVCASSPLVIDRDGRVVHAGVALLRGLPLPVHPGAHTASDDVPPELTMVTNRSAAAGVVALTRPTFSRGGGPSERLDYLALATLTAGLTLGGARVVCSPHAPWRLLGRPRPNDLEELRAFAIEHAGRKDRYYNPRLWPDNAAHIVPRALQQTGLLSDAQVF